MKPIHYCVPFFNLLLAALLGVLLRSAFVYPLEGMTFLYVLHGHSHVALLGWLYLLIYVLFVDEFALDTPREHRFYRRLFWVTQISVLGMALTFPFQGYAWPSIFFSTLHILCSYIFVYRLWRYSTFKQKQQALWVKTALFFMFFSTIGVWCLGPAIGLMGKATAFFQLCIQFFLHFQFDGWFFTASLALLFSFVFSLDHTAKPRLVFWVLWIISVALTYALPVSWYIEAPLLYYLNGGGVVLQTIAIMGLSRSVLKAYKKRPKLSLWLDSLVALALGSIVIRLVVQLLTLFAPLATALNGLRSWIVGFIHLNMLGIFTAFGLWFLLQKRKIGWGTATKIGIVCLLLGFVLTEGLLGLQGAQQFLRFSLLDAHTVAVLLFWFSLFLPLGVICILCNRTKNKTT